MSTLQEMQSRYAELIKANSKVSKNRRRYSKAFGSDMVCYSEEGR